MGQCQEHVLHVIECKCAYMPAFTYVRHPVSSSGGGGGGVAGVQKTTSR